MLHLVLVTACRSLDAPATARRPGGGATRRFFVERGAVGGRAIPQGAVAGAVGHEATQWVAAAARARVASRPLGGRMRPYLSSCRTRCTSHGLDVLGGGDALAHAVQPVRARRR